MPINRRMRNRDDRNDDTTKRIFYWRLSKKGMENDKSKLATAESGDDGTENPVGKDFWEGFQLRKI